MGGTWLPHCPAGGEPRGLDSARPCLSLRASPARARPAPATADLFRRKLSFELAPTVQLAHDLGDVHGVGCFSGLGFFFQLPQDDGARAGTQVAPHEWEAGAGRKDRAAVGGKGTAGPAGARESLMGHGAAGPESGLVPSCSQ